MKKLISIMLVSVLILATSTVYADELSDGIVENEIGNLDQISFLVKKMTKVLK